MDERFWEALQHLSLGRNDPDIAIPYHAYATVLARNRLSLLGRPLNPMEQNFEQLVEDLPREWGLPSRVHGRILDPHFVQFLFFSEMDLLSILQRQPVLYNNWFIALQRWEDHPLADFLTTIDICVQLRGLPLQYVSDQTSRIIAGSLGEVLIVDFEPPTIARPPFVRARVRINITNRIRFYRYVSFQNGDIVLVCFFYENLSSLCFHCQRIIHHLAICAYFAPPVNHFVDLVAMEYDDNQTTKTPDDFSNYESLSPTLPSQISQQVRPLHVDIQQTNHEVRSTLNVGNDVATTSNPTNMEQVNDKFQKRKILSELNANVPSKKARSL